jgi:hypothetical protein
VIFKRKKRKDFNILTESKVQKKLYGYLEAQEGKNLKDFEERAKLIEKEQAKKDADDRIKALEKELILTREALQISRQKISQLENKVSAERKKLTSKRLYHFNLNKNLKIFLVLMMVAIGSLFILISRKKMVNLDGRQEILLERTEKPILPKSFYTIQVCVYEKEKDAQRLVNELKQKKFDAYLYSTSSKSKTKYRVYVGKFSSEKKALITQKNLRKYFKDSFIRLVK